MSNELTWLFRRFAWEVPQKINMPGWRVQLINIFLARLDPLLFGSRGGLILIRLVNALALAKLRRHAWLAQTAAGIAFALRAPLTQVAKH